MPRTVAVRLALLLLLVSACGASAAFTQRGPACAALSRGCAFDVLSTRPARDYVVLGVLDLEAASVRALPRTDDEFRRVVANHVCRAGGNAVLPGINGDGRYVLGTVVRYLDLDSEKPFCDPPGKGPAPGRGKSLQAGGYPRPAVASARSVP